MPTFREMDQQVTLSARMEEMSGPVILINTFTVSADEIAPILRAWTADASGMKRQPGFISAQLHRGITVVSPHLFQKLAIPGICVD